MNLHSPAKVKQEKRDDQEEIDQLAAKMVEANRAKMASAVSNGSGQSLNAPLNGQVLRAGQQSLLSYFSKPSAVGNNVSREKSDQPKNGDSAAIADEESVKGRFGWTDEPVVIPYIFRGRETYCPVRIIEQQVVKPYSSLLRAEICSCVNIQGYYTSTVEAQLLNEINVKHSECRFGREPFTVRDLVVKVEDAVEFLKFLQTCQSKLVQKSADQNDRCGFFRIGGESVVPYTLVNGIKHVPLFYFEGEMGNLDKKSVQISGWDLAYLKLCCKVQGIREELFTGHSYPGVSIDEIRQQFPANTELQLYWPARSQLDKQNSASSSLSSSTWVKKPAGNPPPLPTAAAPAAQPSSLTAAKTSGPTAGPSSVSRPPVVVPSAAAAAGTSSGSSSSSRPVATVSAAPVERWRSAPVYNPNPAAAQSVQNSSSTSSNSSSSRNSSSSSGNARTAAAAYSSASQQQIAASQLISALSTPTRAAAAAVAAAQGLPLPLSLPLSLPANLNAVAANYMAAVLEYQNRQNMVNAAAAAAASQALRANGVPSDNYRSSYASVGVSSAPITSTAGRPPYSTSQSPLTGIVPGTSPHSRSGAGASPRPGNPVPTSGMHLALSSGAPKPPPPLIPVNGSSGKSSLPAAMTSLRQQAQHQHQQPQQQPQEQPFKLQRIPLENQLVPCVNSRQYVFNNLMIALPDMAAYLFPHLSHHACKQVLQDGLGVTLYEANPQQLQVLTADRKASCVSSLPGEKIYLVNVRDVIQYMPQIKYMMSRLDHSDFARATHSKRQRVS